jgi:hypothetical protein
MVLREKADMAARAIGFYPPESGRDSNGRPFRVVLRIYPTVLNHCQWYLIAAQWAVIPAVQPGLPISAIYRLSALCLTQILK